MKGSTLFLAFVFLFLGRVIYSFPGDHNSLTCDKNFLGVKATIDGVPDTPISDTNEKNPDGSEKPNTGMLGKYFRKSLSDFVNFYGVLTPGALGAGVPIPPVGGIYGGSPLWIDSWSDYFSIYGQPQLSPVYVRNYGIATYQTPTVMDLMGFSSYYDGVNGWWDINNQMRQIA